MHLHRLISSSLLLLSTTELLPNVALLLAEPLTRHELRVAISALHDLFIRLPRLLLVLELIATTA